jgi:hypothetical protein
MHCMIKHDKQRSLLYKNDQQHCGKGILVSRGFAHARGIDPHAQHPQIIISYVYLL